MLYHHHIVHLHHYSGKGKDMRRVVVRQLVDLVDTRNMLLHTYKILELSSDQPISGIQYYDQLLSTLHLYVPDEVTNLKYKNLIFEYLYHQELMNH